jgi:glycosyltransferase involved in cell wall biosynthesis
VELRATVVEDGTSGHETVPNIRIFFDASLTLHHGYLSPVGIVRAEHYVGELLVKDPSVHLRFIIYNRERASYRPTTVAEEGTLRNILLRRYEADNGGPAKIFLSSSISADSDEQELINNYPRKLKFRIGAAMRLSPNEFAVVSGRLFGRLVPITDDESALLRLIKRVLRRGALVVVRLAHRIQASARQALRWAVRCADPKKRVESSQYKTLQATENLDTGLLPGRGDILISMSNLWDYMDYKYLDLLCRRDGVHFVSVIYDVIAMQLPFTSPGPPHIYHRHWVEIGHLASHLLAISRYSADSYKKFITEPNGISVSLSHAYLPNFLKERSVEIGEVPVAGLDQRPFVVYCSTIEIRKNHQILLHVWDLLTEKLGPDQMPTLVFVGKWGWGTETVRQLVERNRRVRNHLRVLDSVSDAELVWLYRNARFSVFPSHSEGFGLAAAESLSFGTPVVISDCPALVEASEGLMPAHSPHDLPGWYEDIWRLVTDDVRLEELRAAAKRYRGPTYDEFGLAVLNTARMAAAPKSGTSLCQDA